MIGIEKIEIVLKLTCDLAVAKHLTKPAVENWDLLLSQATDNE